MTSFNRISISLTIILGFIFLINISISAFSQTEAIDKLRIELSNEANDSIKVELLMELHKHYLYLSVDSSFLILERGIQIAKGQNLQTELGKLYAEMTQVYLHKGSLDSALVFTLKAAEIYTLLDDSVGLMIITANGFGRIYSYKGEIEKGKAYLETALAYFIRHKNYALMADIYNALSLNSYRQKDFQTSLEYNIKSIEALKQTNFKKDIALHRTLAIYLNNAGKLNYRLKNIDKALNYYDQALVINKELKQDRSIARVSVNLSEIYRSLGDFKNAINHAQIAFDFGEKQDDLHFLRDGARELYMSYETAGNHKQALDMHKKYAQTKEKMYNQAQSMQIAELATKYETEKKEQENESLKTQTKLDQKTIVFRDLS